MSDTQLKPRAAVSEIREALLEKYPREFRHGYLSGYLGEHQHPCDSAGYMIGHHTWPAERRNAWFCGFNLGHAEREFADG
jgi:hypothetical protein